MKKLLVSLTAVAVVSAAFVAAPTHAEACYPEQAFHPEIIEDDTPDCIEFTRYYSSSPEGSTMDYTIRSECDETFEMTALDCVGCDEEVVVEPSEDDSPSSQGFVLEGNDWDELEEGETYQQYYEWTLGDQQGVFTTETEFTGPGEGCAPLCSTAGDSLPTDMVVLMALVFAVLGIRQGSFTPQA